MAMGAAYSIIWLDAHIGIPGEYNKIKEKFNMNLLETAVVPPALPESEMDKLICKIHEYCAPVIFVSTEDEALNEIRNYFLDKKVIFITSASMGRKIVPQILQENLSIHLYYIFCGDMKLHTDWGNECIDEGLRIEMFDFETDILVRLARDMSEELISEGKKLLEDNKPESALKYFEYARSIAEKAVECDTSNNPNDSHRPSAEHRRKLDGENGLIAKAKRAME